MEIDLQRRTDLNNPALMGDRQAVGHCHRLGIVRGRVESGRSPPLLDVPQLGVHAVAQLGVQMRNRLVEEEDGRLANEGTAERYALLLAAAQLGRHAAQQLVDLEHPGDRAHPLVAGLGRVAAGGPRRAQREGKVLVDREMRIERVALEGHRHVAVGGIEPRCVAPADEDPTAGRLDEAGDEVERGRLAGSGWARAA